MAEALDYINETGPPDVAETLALLIAEGFELRHERGGRGESFGNVLVELERPPLAIRINNDRGQWTIDISPNGSDYEALHVLVTAKHESEPWLEERTYGDPIAEQWPPGLRWHEAVPELIRWIESGDRTSKIRDAHDQWVAVLRGRYVPEVR